MRSIHVRLFVSASILLVVFLSLTAVALERAFRQSVEVATKERLLANVYGLIGSADIGENGHLIMPPSLPEARFSNPNSGLFAIIYNRSKDQYWRSASLLTLKFTEFRDLKPAEPA